jgi:hypothetical protein
MENGWIESHTRCRPRKYKDWVSVPQHMAWHRGSKDELIHKTNFFLSTTQLPGPDLGAENKVMIARVRILAHLVMTKVVLSPYRNYPSGSVKYWYVLSRR